MSPRSGSPHAVQSTANAVPCRRKRSSANGECHKVMCPAATSSDHGVHSSAFWAKRAARRCRSGQPGSRHAVSGMRARRCGASAQWGMGTEQGAPQLRRSSVAVLISRDRAADGCGEDPSRRERRCRVSQGVSGHVGRMRSAPRPARARRRCQSVAWSLTWRGSVRRLGRARMGPDRH